MKYIFGLLFLLTANLLMAQPISGTVSGKKSKLPVAYVNIGITGKNIGTVSDPEGRFDFPVAAEYDSDSLLFSCIGYDPYSVRIGDLRKAGFTNIVLKEKIHDLKEVVIHPKVYQEKILGIVTDSKFLNAGFGENQLGHEMGILMRVKKSAALKRVDFNIANCSYDTVFYRLNIYKVTGKMSFENILPEPIYINLPMSKVTDKISMDLTSYHIVADGDFLVTLELVKDLGPGNLYFCSRLKDKTYYRKTSQGAWETGPVGISISVLADVEK